MKSSTPPVNSLFPPGSWSPRMGSSICSPSSARTSPHSSPASASPRPSGTSGGTCLGRTRGSVSSLKNGCARTLSRSGPTSVRIPPLRWTSPRHSSSTRCRTSSYRSASSGLPPPSALVPSSTSSTISRRRRSRNSSPSVVGAASSRPPPASIAGNSPSQPPRLFTCTPA